MNCHVRQTGSDSGQKLKEVVVKLHYSSRTNFSFVWIYIWCVCITPQTNYCRDPTGNIQRTSWTNSRHERRHFDELVWRKGHSTLVEIPRTCWGRKSKPKSADIDQKRPKPFRKNCSWDLRRALQAQIFSTRYARSGIHLRVMPSLIQREGLFFRILAVIVRPFNSSQSSSSSSRPLMPLLADGLHNSCRALQSWATLIQWLLPTSSISLSLDLLSGFPLTCLPVECPLWCCSFWLCVLPTVPLCIALRLLHLSPLSYILSPHPRSCVSSWCSTIISLYCYLPHQKFCYCPCQWRQEKASRKLPIQKNVK